MTTPTLQPSYFTSPLQVPTPDTFEVDVHDPRFSALYESHLYAPDPSHPHYRPTKAMVTLMREKQKRRKRGDSLGASVRFNGGEKTVSNPRYCSSTLCKPERLPRSLRVHPSVASLVKSVKAKAGSFTEHRKKLGAKRLKKQHP